MTVTADWTLQGLILTHEPQYIFSLLSSWGGKGWNIFGDTWRPARVNTAQGISPGRVTQGSWNQCIDLDGCQCGSKNICPKFVLALQILLTLIPIAFQRDYFSPLKSSQLHKAAWAQLWPEPSWFLTLNNISKLLWGSWMTVLRNCKEGFNSANTQVTYKQFSLSDTASNFHWDHGFFVWLHNVD